MRFLAYSLATFALYALQAVLVALFVNSSVKPDLPLIVVFCIALMRGEMAGGVAGLIYGFIDDAIYGSFFGITSLAKFCSAYALGHLTRNMYRGPAIITMFTVFLGFMLYHFSIALVGSFTKTLANPWYSFMGTAVSSSFLNMLISPLVYAAIVKGERFFDYYFNVKY